MTLLQEEGSEAYSRELHILAYKPQFHTCYAQCYVNGIKYVTSKRDKSLKTQNSGIMVQAGDIKYYGRLKNIIELQYAEGMPVVVFKCKWYNTDPMERGTNFKIEHGLLSINTSTTWYEDSPYCLATKAQQVFYLEDPKMEGRWMVVNEVAQRGTYSNSCVARGAEEGDNNEDNVNEPYQEDGVTNIPMYMENEQEEEEEEYDEDHMLAFGSLVNLDTVLDDDQLNMEDVEDMEEVDFDYAQQTDDEVEVYEDVSGDEE